MSDYSLKTMMNKPERLAPGHRMCAGCGATIAVRAVLRGLHEGDRAVIGNATGCLEVSSFMYPYTAWEDSYIHNAFENAGATLSGVETAYKALKKRGKLPKDETFKFITFGGDGGTYDIGFQSLSGAMERGSFLSILHSQLSFYLSLSSALSRKSRKEPVIFVYSVHLYIIKTFPYMHIAHTETLCCSTFLKFHINNPMHTHRLFALYQPDYGIGTA